MLPNEITVAIVITLNLVLVIRVTRRANAQAMHLLPLILCLVSKLAYTLLSIKDMMTPHTTILSAEAREVWSITLRLQAGLAMFSLLLNYAGVLDEVEAFRRVKRFFNELDHHH